MLPGLGQQPVDHRVVVLSWLRFEILPVHGYLDGVDVHVFQGAGHTFERVGQSPIVRSSMPMIRNGASSTNSAHAPVLLHQAWQRTSVGVNGLDLGPDRTTITKAASAASVQYSAAEYAFMFMALLNASLQEPREPN